MIETFERKMVFGHTVLEVYTSSHPFLTETFFKNLFLFPFNISSFVVSEISSIASLGDWGSLKLLAYLKVISQSGRPLRSKSHKAISAIPSYQLWLASQKKIQPLQDLLAKGPVNHRAARHARLQWCPWEVFVAGISMFASDIHM